MGRMCLVVRRGFLVLLVSFWGINCFVAAFGLVRNQDGAVAPAEETGEAYRCQRVPNDATLVLLSPVTTGSEEDPGTPAGRLDPGSSPASRGNPGRLIL